jgi:2-oxo-4-hydroxy-4-carboxy--5-ureidoimidazoline (OHCU) decarboxylase
VDDRPSRLSVGALAGLFEGRTRLLCRLAARPDPLGDAQALVREIPEDELIEALNAHPRIGARTLSPASAREQGADEDPAVLDELRRLNEMYEAAFGFRFVVFVNRRPKSEIVRVLGERLRRSRQDELGTGVAELLAIARARYRDATAAGRPPRQ